MGNRGSFKGLNLVQGLGVVSSWLRLANGTVTGAGYSSVPDILASPDNPAVQATDGSRPPQLFSANGLPIADFNGDFLSHPAAANNNATTADGFAVWFKPDNVGVALRGLLSGLPASATNRMEIMQFGADLLVDVYISQFSARRGTLSAALAADTWVFLTWEYDITGATDALKCVVTLNGVVQTLAFSDTAGAPGAMPSVLVATAGPYILGARGPAGAGQLLDGKFGPNIYRLGAKMASATTGLLTPGGRDILMNLERPE